jgi:glutamate--cysteine ligase
MTHPISETEARARVAQACISCGPLGRVGVELEWVVADPRDPNRPVPLDRIADLLAYLPNPLPGGAVLTVEPGGQLELSSQPCDGLSDCLISTSADVALLRSLLEADGLELMGTGLDPVRAPRRLLEHPRYAAMETFYGRFGTEGKVLMCGSASVQVCLEAGDDSDGVTGYRYRWQLAHELGPVLIAAFANSALRRGRPTGWRSTRMAFRFRADPRRTRPPNGPDPRQTWPEYAMNAQLLCLQRPAPLPWTAPPGLTFAEWLRGHGPRRPSWSDLEYHLTTLFPPIRPRGYLELRMIDTQVGDDWWVPLAVVTALLDDPVAADAARAAIHPLYARRQRDLWLRAARHGAGDPLLGAAARTCFEAALPALHRMDVPEQVCAAVASFAERYPWRGRCPADDQLDAFHAEQGVPRSSVPSG